MPEDTNDAAGSQASRRALLAVAGASPVLAWASRAGAQARQVAGFDPKLAPSVATLGRWMKQLHDFGPIRADGTKQARDYEEWLARQFADLGCTVERDQFRLTAWEGDIRTCSIEIKEDAGSTRKLEVLAYYPFTASTKGKAAVSGRVIYGGSGDSAGPELVKKVRAEVLKDAIVVMDMPVTGLRSFKYYPGTYPEKIPPLPNAPSPGWQTGRTTMEALENRCRGVIYCFTDISDEAGRYNYLPFSDNHRKIPGLWVGRDSGTYLKSVAGKATATMRNDAVLTPNARTDSFIATLKGQSDETVIITTHTDGPNEINDDGSLGVLALASYAAKVPAAKRRRTIVFCLPTGHYAGGAIADPQTGSGRRAGTRGVMKKWPDLGNKAVAQLALEQMGGLEWNDEGGRWHGTQLPSAEHWISTPGVEMVMHKLLIAAAQGEDPRYSRIALVESGQAPGEGGSLRSAGIPGLGLMGTPHYFFRADPKGVLDKMSPQVMKNQVNVATKLLVLFDRLSTAQLQGKAPITDRDIFG